MLTRLKSSTIQFRNREDGSATIETVLWLPVLFMVFALATDSALLFFGQNRAYRVVQDANRALSVGRLSSEAEVESYITDKLSPLSPHMTVTTTIALGTVESAVTMPSNDLLATGLIEPLVGSSVHVQASHLVEY